MIGQDVVAKVEIVTRVVGIAVERKRLDQGIKTVREVEVFLEIERHRT